MECPRCLTPNPADAVFCEECGSRLEAACLSCGESNRLSAKCIVRRHVGIYVGDGDFVHSSASSGVIKSSLDSGYWDDHYWKSKRLMR